MLCFPKILIVDGKVKTYVINTERVNFVSFRIIRLIKSVIIFFWSIQFIYFIWELFKYRTELHLVQFPIKNNNKTMMLLFVVTGFAKERWQLKSRETRLRKGWNSHEGDEEKGEKDSQRQTENCQQTTFTIVTSKTRPGIVPSA